MDGSGGDRRVDHDQRGPRSHVLRPRVRAGREGLCGQKRDVRHPYVSPLYGRFDGLPPLFFQVGDTEVLLDDSTRVAEKARAAGVSVELNIWPKMPHVFQMFAPFMPEANRALEQAAAFVRRVTALQAVEAPQTS